MSRKAYSQQERTALKKRLHEIGLDIYLKQGIQNVKLPEILQLAGISKPFFYTFYPSLGDLIIDIIDEQRISIMKLLAFRSVKASSIPGGGGMAVSAADKAVL